MICRTRGVQRNDERNEVDSLVEIVPPKVEIVPLMNRIVVKYKLGPFLKPIVYKIDKMEN